MFVVYCTSSYTKVLDHAGSYCINLDLCLHVKQKRHTPDKLITMKK